MLMSESLTQKKNDVAVLSGDLNAGKTAEESNAIGASVALASGTATCDSAEGLSAIHEPATGLVIWRRAIPLCLQTWIERLDAARLPDLRVLVRPDELRHAVEPHLDDCAMPPGDMRDLLLTDVDDLVSVFSEVAATDFVDVRLERVSHDACWKFHRDRVDARFLITYRGPATEWVRPIHAERALREQTEYDGPVEQLESHDAVLFKGSRAGDETGIVHRSPPIERTGHTRLLLCLNKPSVTSPEAWSSSL